MAANCAKSTLRPSSLKTLLSRSSTVVSSTATKLRGISPVKPSLSRSQLFTLSRLASVVCCWESLAFMQCLGKFSLFSECSGEIDDDVFVFCQDPQWVGWCAFRHATAQRHCLCLVHFIAVFEQPELGMSVWRYIYLGSSNLLALSWIEITLFDPSGMHDSKWRH